MQGSVTSHRCNAFRWCCSALWRRPVHSETESHLMTRAYVDVIFIAHACGGREQHGGR